MIFKFSKFLAGTFFSANTGTGVCENNVRFQFSPPRASFRIENSASDAENHGESENDAKHIKKPFHKKNRKLENYNPNFPKLQKKTELVAPR